MTMDRPVVFIEVELFSSVMMTVLVAGLVFERVELVSAKELLHPLCTVLYKCRTSGNTIFTRFIKFMESAAERED